MEEETDIENVELSDIDIALLHDHTVTVPPASE
jgi:hypothetical protein